MTRLQQGLADALWCPPDIAEMLLFYHSIEQGVAAFKEQQAASAAEARAMAGRR